MSEILIQPEANHSPKMDEFLNHHGIKGMKWGVRRTPEQLGHATARKQPSSENKTAKKVPAKKTSGKSARSSSSLSDDELQKRINRLNMEERYEDLVARQKARGNTGFKATAKKLVGNAAEDLGRQLLSKAVSKLVDRIAGDKNFDISDYIDRDVRAMDSDTISKVATWYENAYKIKDKRASLSGKNNEQSPKKNGDSKQNTGSNGGGNTESKKKKKSSKRNQEILDYISKDEGYRLEAEARRLARDPRNRNRDSIVWLI